MTNAIEEQVRNAAMIALRSMPNVTVENVRDVVRASANFLAPLHGMTVDDVDLTSITRDIETTMAIWAPDSSELLDNVGHVPWLDDKRESVHWDYWHRYELYLEQRKHLPPQVLARLDTITDRILGNLEDASRIGSWSRRGMVVGQVQSGKTANYTGLICKAVDAGYKLIVVLAGMHNSLRSQTQLRLDEGFIGRDTKQSRAFSQESGVLGAGSIIVTDRRLAVYSPTSSADDGDFKAQIARQFTTYIGNDPVILVVKKNGSVLKHLLKWVKTNLADRDSAGHTLVRGLPLLMLDDEADNASVNTKEDAPAKINELIRATLSMFERSAYVGYTATPFANIFIPPDASSPELGDDLFPRSFIINLHPPSNYMGPAQVFGLSALPDTGLDAIVKLPIVRQVRDAEALIPASHKKHLLVSELPKSMKEAIRSFVLTCAARRARGQETDHNSMLIHVTRYNLVQEQVADLVGQELRDLKQRIEYGDGERVPTLMTELRNVWDLDFIPTSVEVKQSVQDEQMTSLTWEEVQPHLRAAASKIQVRTINGQAGDVLDYFDHPNGISVIAVGGDKLSRGLTLEGLSTSYYLRASRMYDTLMQMGRWFGYRPGYADLCRLYTSKELVEWYEHITLASEELRQDFDRMASARMTPLDYGLKVQTHPGGLTITNAGKMRSGRKVRVSFAGSLVESYRLQKAPEIIQNNFGATDAFIGRLATEHYQRRQMGHVWTDVGGVAVCEYLDQLVGHPDLPVADPRHLSEYINKKLGHGELTNWTVVLVDRTGGADDNHRRIGPYDVRLTPRKREGDFDETTYVVANRHIISMDDEAIDLSPIEYGAALTKAQDYWDEKRPATARPVKPSGPFIRAERQPSRALLLIYPLDPAKEGVFEDASDMRRNGPPVTAFAISFPRTERVGEAVEYLANDVYLREEEEIADDGA